MRTDAEKPADDGDERPPAQPQRDGRQARRAVPKRDPLPGPGAIGRLVEEFADPGTRRPRESRRPFRRSRSRSPRIPSPPSRRRSPSCPTGRARRSDGGRAARRSCVPAHEDHSHHCQRMLDGRPACIHDQARVRRERPVLRHGRRQPRPAHRHLAALGRTLVAHSRALRHRCRRGTCPFSTALQHGPCRRSAWPSAPRSTTALGIWAPYSVSASSWPSSDPSSARQSLRVSIASGGRWL
jgi:hypothetical protein